LPRVQTANSEMSQFESTQRQLYASKLALAHSPSDKQQVLSDYTKSVTDKQNQLLKPLVDQTRSVTANVARKKNLLLIVDRADVIYGGSDITSDVQNALAK
jgi:outer membrane protein